MIPSQLEAGIANYGSAEAHKLLGRVNRPQKKAASPALIIGCLVVPWLIFVFTNYTMGFSIRYWAAPAAYAVAFIAFVVCLVFGWMAVGAAQGKGGDPLWLGLLCFISLVGWAWGLCAGSATYSSLMQPYYDVQQLNVYQSVDPSIAEGNQYMDFGIIKFVEHARIDRVFSMAFKNDDTYCVAPVKVNNTFDLSSYDFWAVGINCCSSHLYDFRCGEWNNPAAHSGLRVVRESQRAFYQLAARQAASAFNIPVKHPVFFEWVEYPQVQIDGYQQDALRSLVNGAFAFFLFEVAAIIVAAWCFSKA